MPDPSRPPIRILAADDHPLILAGIGAVIAEQPDMTLVAEANDGIEAVTLFKQHRPDVVLIDLQMPRMNGLAAIADIRIRAPETRILVLTTFRGDMQALRAIKAGATGYLLKTMIRKELVTAIREIHAGRRYIAAEVALELSVRTIDEALSPREVEVIGEVAAGRDNKQVAQRLGVTEETVKTHMKNILAKLNADDRLQAVVIAMRRGIIDAAL
jgi:two-component system, NarL family, response regulator